MSNYPPGNGSDVTLREIASGQKLFRRYTLKKILGRGGMGIVWLARDEDLELDVALKFLPDLIIHDRAVLSDLKRETKRSLGLTHKNIVRIYDFVHDENSGCISMEYVDGDTLSNIRSDRPSKVFECWELGNWTKQLCEALDYAHNHAQVVHRDLKPSNLMANQRGDLKVADFGIARNLSESVSMLTMGQHTSGTLLYMSPQQLDGGRGTPLDDVYSFGATIYELLTSKPPFYSGNIDRQIHERIPPRMGNRREELEIEGEPIDETWENLVATCLRKDPALRPQSALEIVRFLTAPTPKTSRRMMDWLKFPSRTPDQKTAQRPTPPSTKTRPPTVAPPPRPKRESQHRFRRAGVALLAGGTAIVRGFANGSTAVGKTFQEIDAIIIAATRAIFRSVALGAISATTASIRGAGRALVATATAIFRAASAIAHASGNIVLAAGRVLLIITKETVRGTAVAVLPAAAVAGCIWYIANRPPPKPRVVVQPLAKTQPSQPRMQPSPLPENSPVVAAIVPPPPQPAALATGRNQALEKTDESSRLELRGAPAPASVVQGSAPPESSFAAGAMPQLPSPPTRSSPASAPNEIAMPAIPPSSAAVVSEVSPSPSPPAGGLATEHVPAPLPVSPPSSAGNNGIAGAYVSPSTTSGESNSRKPQKLGKPASRKTTEAAQTTPAKTKMPAPSSASSPSRAKASVRKTPPPQPFDGSVPGN